jgi:hypothetical protein
MRRPLVLFALVAACFSEPAFHAHGGGGDDGGGSDEPPNLVFVTSTTQAPGSLGGLAGADAICNQLAGSANLPGMYVAWLSDSMTSARQRLGSASGWARVDGKPFARTIDDLVAGKIWYPPRIDEHGYEHTDPTDKVITATNPDGTADSARTCQDFTMPITTADLMAGSPSGGTVEWTTGGANLSVRCDFPARLYCFGVDRNTVVAPPTGSGRVAFVTTQTFGFSSMGIAKADTLCTNEAQSAGLTGMFKALLATTGASAASRFTLAGMPWYRTDGVLLTDDLTNLAAPLDVGAGKQYLADPLGTAVWTGAATPEAAGSDSTTCLSWTNTNSGNAITGDPFVSSTAWWNTPITSACGVSQGHGVYCFQQ